MVCQFFDRNIKRSQFFKLNETPATCGCWFMYICKCVFACVHVFRILGRPADNKGKCSPSTAVFNWSNRPKGAGSCCPNNKALCSLSLSTGRSMWNNNTPLHVSATTIQQPEQQLIAETKLLIFILDPASPASKHC